MKTDYPEKVTKLKDIFLNSPGETNPALRQTITAHAAVLSGADSQEAGPIPAAMQSYLDKVALHAYKTTDEDIQRLKAANYSEDEIFELTISAALGAALARLERGLDLVNGR